jgi:hypothetical protein
MATETADLAIPAPASQRGWSSLWKVEDWWSIWIGLGLVGLAITLFKSGSSLKWLAIAPAKWHGLADLGVHFAREWPRYLALLVAWSVLFGLGARALGLPLRRFLPSFLFVFVTSLLIYSIGQWDQSTRFNLEPPLVALALGLLVSNTVGLPRWMDTGFRVEFYVKTGIVLLGAGVPLALILWAGPVAIGQAAIVSLATFGVIYFVATRLGLDRRLAVTLGAGVDRRRGCRRRAARARADRDYAGDPVGYRHDLRAADPRPGPGSAHRCGGRMDWNFGIRGRGRARGGADLRRLCGPRPRN